MYLSGALPSCPSHALDHPDRTVQSIKADDKVHLANVQTLLGDARGHEAVKLPRKKRLHDCLEHPEVFTFQRMIAGVCACVCEFTRVRACQRGNTKMREVERMTRGLPCCTAQTRASVKKHHAHSRCCPSVPPTPMHPTTAGLTVGHVYQYRTALTFLLSKIFHILPLYDIYSS